MPICEHLSWCQVICGAWPNAMHEDSMGTRPRISLQSFNGPACCAQPRKFLMLYNSVAMSYMVLSRDVSLRRNVSCVVPQHGPMIGPNTRRHKRAAGRCQAGPSKSPFAPSSPSSSSSGATTSAPDVVDAPAASAGQWMSCVSTHKWDYQGHTINYVVSSCLMG